MVLLLPVSPTKIKDWLALRACKKFLFVTKLAKSSSSQESHRTSTVRTSSPPIGHIAYHRGAAPLEVV